MNSKTAAGSPGKGAAEVPQKAGAAPQGNDDDVIMLTAIAYGIDENQPIGELKKQVAKAKARDAAKEEKAMKAKEMKDATAKRIAQIMGSSGGGSGNIGSSSPGSNGNGAPPQSAQRSGLETMIINITAAYCENHPVTMAELLDPLTGPVRIETIRDELLELYNSWAMLENMNRMGGSAIKPPQTLPGAAAAMVLLSTGEVFRLQPGGILVARHYYLDGGRYRWSGIYSEIKPDDAASNMMRVFRGLCPNAVRNHETAEFLAYLSDAPVRTLGGGGRHIVFCRNGVWDFDKAATIPGTDRRAAFMAYDDPAFDREYPDAISLSKLPVHHPYGTNPEVMLHPEPDGTCREPELQEYGEDRPWRPSDAYTAPFDLSTETGRAASRIMLETMHFLIRKDNPGHYLIWFDELHKGNNGKSTLGDMMCRLVDIQNREAHPDLGCGGEAVIPVSLEGLTDNNLAGSIKTAYIIIGTETMAATQPVKDCERVKKLSRHETIQFRQLYHMPFPWQYRGILVQQCNDIPRFADRTDSLTKTLILAPFQKSISYVTESMRHIKEDYVLREEVAEWLLWKVTTDMGLLDGYSRDALQALEPYKNDMMADANKTFDFMNEAVQGSKMDFLPAEYLFDMYLRWCAKNHVAYVLDFPTFQMDLMKYGEHNNFNVAYEPPYRNKRGSVGGRTGRRYQVDGDALQQRHPLVREYGQVYVNGYTSEYAANSWSSSLRCETCNGWLKAEKFRTASGTMRWWNRGGLVRRNHWQDVIQDDEE